MMAETVEVSVTRRAVVTLVGQLAEIDRDWAYSDAPFDPPLKVGDRLMFRTNTDRGARFRDGCLEVVEAVGRAFRVDGEPYYHVTGIGPTDYVYRVEPETR